jgi:Uma2 family endonuclease
MLTMEVAEKTYTVEEFLELDLPDDQDYELIRGNIVPKGVPSSLHGEIIFKLSGYLLGYLLNNPIGRGFSEAGCTLGRPAGSNAVKPDISYVSTQRLQGRFEGPIPVAPDLLVEVVSPNDTIQSVREKLEDYFTEGVKTVWIIYTSLEYATVYKENWKNMAVVSYDEELSDDEILPGFKIALKKLFEQ